MVIGLLSLALAIASGALYLIRVEALHRPPWSTRPFDVGVVAGTLLAAAATWWLLAPLWILLSTLAVCAIWFGITHLYLVVPSGKAKVGVGDAFPAFRALTSAGAPFTLDDLLQRAPAVLVLYRGLW